MRKMRKSWNFLSEKRKEKKKREKKKRQRRDELSLDHPSSTLLCETAVY